jgi:NADH dehydrogenase [ubiquinone] 1 alpha subcomplex assembly factor 7
MALTLAATPLGPISQSQFLLSLGLQPRLNKLLVSAPSDQRRAELRNGAKRLVDTLGMGSQYQALGVVPNDEPAGEAYPFS